MSILSKTILERTEGMVLSGYLYIKSSTLFTACREANTNYSLGVERCKLLGVWIT